MSVFHWCHVACVSQLSLLQHVKLIWFIVWLDWSSQSCCMVQIRGVWRKIPFHFFYQPVYIRANCFHYCSTHYLLPSYHYDFPWQQSICYCPSSWLFQSLRRCATQCCAEKYVLTFNCIESFFLHHSHMTRLDSDVLALTSVSANIIQGPGLIMTLLFCHCRDASGSSVLPSL